MPFGAQRVVDGDAYRFRLWAPAAQAVDLCLEQATTTAEFAMSPQGDGWFSAEIPGALPGDGYSFRIDGDLRVPDPASRCQPDDVHAPSRIVDPLAFEWQDADWRGRPWEEVVLYELHVGTFTPEGTFAGVVGRLDYLTELGVTAIELMPVSDWPGARNWGYDGVYPFAPDSRYGTPDDLKRLVQETHARGLMIFLDVVYNHFGPEGNYLHRYAPQFFTDRVKTPWGAAIDFGGSQSRPVREFFVENALFWLNEYNFDGLRLDAVHAIYDQSHPDILSDIATAVAARVDGKRRVHLVLENDDNAAHYLDRPTANDRRFYSAQWNDDIHHVLHFLLTGEDRGYYGDYAHDPIDRLGRALTQGFVYQGENSPYRDGTVRGEPSGHLPATAFVSFLQNHDQIGNRAFGERIATLADEQAVRAAATLLLLAPSPPLIFMGEEWAATNPFLFFCDFEAGLADAVRDGRRQEFSGFPEFGDEERRARIPDPGDPQTFRKSMLDWSEPAKSPPHRDCLAFYRDLLALRHREIVPRLGGLVAGGARYDLIDARALSACWAFDNGARLTCFANLGAEAADGIGVPPGVRWLTTGSVVPPDDVMSGRLPPWSVAWAIEDPSPALAR